MNCPNCKREVVSKKNAIFKCVCGRTLIIVEINKIKQIVDVTPDKEEKWMFEQKQDYLIGIDLAEGESVTPWKITNDEDAEWLIEKYNVDLVEKARYKLALENKIRDLQDKLRKVEDEEKFAIERRNSYLLEYFETIDEKFKKKTKTQEKYRLPSGEIVKKYPSPEYKRDGEKLLSWIKSNDLNDYVEVKESPKWAELKKATTVVGGQVVFKDTGEIVEGVELIERPPVIEFKEG